MWKPVLSLFAMAALIAMVSCWHGATDSVLSRTALYLLPCIPLAFLFGFAFRRSSRNPR
jgi:hypothetical protein